MDKRVVVGPPFWTLEAASWMECKASPDGRGSRCGWRAHVSPLASTVHPHPDSCLALYQVTPIEAIDRPPLNRSGCVVRRGVCRRGLRRRVPLREWRCWIAHRRQRTIRRAQARRHTPPRVDRCGCLPRLHYHLHHGASYVLSGPRKTPAEWAPDESATCRRRGRYFHVR